MAASIAALSGCSASLLPGSMRAVNSDLSQVADQGLSPLNKAITETPSKLMTSRQYFMSFLSVAGIRRPNTRFLALYELMKSVLPTQNDLSLLNSPIAMGLTNLAGVTCEQMYDDELARDSQQRIFLEGNDSEDFSNLNVKTFTERLALAAWGEPPSQQESALFQSYYEDFETTAGPNDSPAMKAKGFLVSVCTAVLTAPKSIVF